MQDDLALVTKNLTRPIKQLVWRSADGRIRLENMATSHLFNVLKCLWNKGVTQQYRVPGKIYEFPVSLGYTDMYVTRIVTGIIVLLIIRRLPPEDQKIFEFVLKHRHLFKMNRDNPVVVGRSFGRLL